jgi:TetR/AcrR family transcriptional regulator
VRPREKCRRVHRRGEQVADVGDKHPHTPSTDPHHDGWGTTYYSPTVRCLHASKVSKSVFNHIMNQLAPHPIAVADPLQQRTILPASSWYPTDSGIEVADVRKRNLLYQRFGSKANLWRTAVDWAFRPLLEYLESSDDESADPMIRLRMLIRNFIEYSATRPYLARLVTVEAATPTDRLEYLYHNYIEPVQSRFVPVFQLLRDQGRIKSIPTEIFYFLLTSGGTAPFGQSGLVSLMLRRVASPDDNQVRLYAENVAEVLLNGMSLPDIRGNDSCKSPKKQHPGRISNLAARPFTPALQRESSPAAACQSACFPQRSTPSGGSTSARSQRVVALSDVPRPFSVTARAWDIDRRATQSESTGSLRNLKPDFYQTSVLLTSISVDHVQSQV